MVTVRRGFGIAAACIVAAIGSGVIASACIVDLPLEISCGDGYVDIEAGEECEPSIPETYERACEGTIRPFGTAVCDPVTCLIDARPLTCHFCGDGEVDAAEPALEQCDGDNFAGKACPGGVGVLRCTSDCRIVEADCSSCKNGHLDEDEGEECDPTVTDTTDLGTERQCAGTSLGTPEDVPPLSSPNPAKPYTSGTTTTCTDECKWNRIGCGYCGDGQVDDRYPIDVAGTPLPQAEQCDGDIVPVASLDEIYPLESEHCAELGAATGLELRANFSCDPKTCQLVSHTHEPKCCLRASEPCPAPDAEFQCCYAYAHPEESEACESAQTTGGIGLPVCKPVGG